eukprot:TRINITY_DN1785_c0_g2_i5.p1 TRINITY_DN1785_c0_g2~~TRINITY_DN1785_c0_g2_i5.p1  ORF type:complete len:311 (+),score=38.45 TRINITY_DN1785_c0_g2_i5:808-1740(+)
MKCCGCPNNAPNGGFGYCASSCSSCVNTTCPPTPPKCGLCSQNSQMKCPSSTSECCGCPNASVPYGTLGYCADACPLRTCTAPSCNFNQTACRANEYACPCDEGVSFTCLSNSSLCLDDMRCPPHVCDPCTNLACSEPGFSCCCGRCIPGTCVLGCVGEFECSRVNLNGGYLVLAVYISNIGCEDYHVFKNGVELTVLERNWAGDESITYSCSITISRPLITTLEAQITLRGQGSRVEAVSLANSFPQIYLKNNSLAILAGLVYQEEADEGPLTDAQVAGIIVGSIFGAFLVVGIVLLLSINLRSGTARG